MLLHVFLLVFVNLVTQSIVCGKLTVIESKRKCLIYRDYTVCFGLVENFNYRDVRNTLRYFIKIIVTLYSGVEPWRSGLERWFRQRKVGCSSRKTWY